MSHTAGDPVEGRGRVALPAGWVAIDPGGEGGAVQMITVADWDPATGLRPTMTVQIEPAGSDPAASRVLTEAQARLPDVHVVSIDPWPVPGSALVGRRLVFAHADGPVTLCTLVWVVSTGTEDVVVTARLEGTHLHHHDRAFADALAGISLPGQPDIAGPEPPRTADLARSAPAVPWASVAPTEGARASIVADPDARILVEAAVGTTSLRFDATLARDQATIAATASPRELSQRAAGAGTEPDEPTTTFRIPVTRLALAVAQWLGLGPAWTPATAPVTVPIRVVMNRLVDPATPPPNGVDRARWQQPWFLWTLRSSATDSGLVMVDTGTSGQCAVMETDDERATRFSPLSSYNVWLTLNWLISESLIDRL